MPRELRLAGDPSEAALPNATLGLRTNSAITGAVRIDVKTPRTGGNTIGDAIAKPNGNAIKAAITHPEQYPAGCD